MRVSSVIALGGNLGDPRANILDALQKISELPGVELKKSSDLYQSHAVTLAGIDETLPKYINGVAEIETELSPSELLSALNQIENFFGRIRSERWASRTLDIDIITYGNLEVELPDLVIPHPRAFHRAFVLVPWAQMDPAAFLPGHGAVAELAAKVEGEVWPYATD